MLPDFPLIKKKVLKALARYASAETFNDPLLSQVRHVSHHEGDRFDTFSQEGAGEHDYSHIEHEFKIDRSELISDGISAFARHMPEVVAAMTGQLDRGFLATVGKVARVSGNEVVAKGKELTPGDLLALYDGMLIEFNNRGMPVWPTAMVNPDNFEAMRACIEQLEGNPNYRRQIEALIEKKRTEWNNRESCRRLVD